MKMTGYFALLLSAALLLPVPGALAQTIEDSAEESDGFGHAVATGDFNGDGDDDLAVGVPDEDLESSDDLDAGAVNVLYGSAGAGLDASGNQIWHQATPGVTGVAEDFDHFGRL